MPRLYGTGTGGGYEGSLEKKFPEFEHTKNKDRLKKMILKGSGDGRQARGTNRRVYETTTDASGPTNSSLNLRKPGQQAVGKKTPPHPMADGAGRSPKTVSGSGNSHGQDHSLSNNYFHSNYKKTSPIHSSNPKNLSPTCGTNYYKQKMTKYQSSTDLWVNDFNITKKSGVDRRVPVKSNVATPTKTPLARRPSNDQSVNRSSRNGNGREARKIYLGGSGHDSKGLGGIRMQLKTSLNKKELLETRRRI